MRRGDTEFGTVADYCRAFAALLKEGICQNHLAILRAHFAAPQHTVSWLRLARAVRYKNHNAVNLHYGTLARRVARHLGIRRKPLDDHGYRWWLWTLVRFAPHRDEETGHTAFVMRWPVVEALRRLNVARWKARSGLSRHENRRARQVPSRPKTPLQEGRIRALVLSRVERNRRARSACLDHYGRRCSVCGFDPARVYGRQFVGVIHVHHLHPMSTTRGSRRVDPIRDLRPLCPNCHVAVHQRQRPWSVQHLRRLIKLARSRRRRG